MHLAPLVAVRQAAWPRPSWCAVFTKAFALVAAGCPELRRSYLSFPGPRLYEHPESIAAVAVERRLDDDSDAVFCARLASPERQGLLELDARLRRLQEAPVETIGPFRALHHTGRWPRALRRAFWWFVLNVSGPGRARHLGTFAVSDHSGLGAAALHPLLPLTTTLSHGVIPLDGAVDVRLIFDHRVLSGTTAAQALDELERVLCNEMVNELRYFQALTPPRPLAA
jgi:hypothetical protein